ncbi:MAG: DUF5777 family beta-barrel protein [Bacteroidota bacterium]
MKSLLFFFLQMLLFVSVASAQDDLMALLEKESDPVSNFAEATFKGSRLINGHSVMTRKKGALEFLIAHRFGRLNTGIYELFGIDGANVRFGLEYGINDQLTVGIGRNSFEKTYDGFAKWAILRQQTGQRNIPLSITGFASMAIKTLKSVDPEIEIEFTDRLAYTYQLLIARKLNEKLSLQLMPSLVHRNEVADGANNDLYALGMGGRFKLSKRLSINAEYYHRFNKANENLVHNSLAIGVDIETGGHVFQLHLTNSRAMIEKGFIGETTGDFFNGDIHFGFNVTRVF